MANVELSSPSVAVQPTFEVTQEDRDLYPQLTDEQLLACDKLSHSWEQRAKERQEFKENHPVEYWKRRVRIKMKNFAKKYL